MKGTSDNRSTLPPSSIHGMRVSRKTSCDGLANNKIKTFARVRFYGFLRPFKFVEKLKGHSENSSFMNDRFLMKFFRRCESCFPFFLVILKMGPVVQVDSYSARMARLCFVLATITSVCLTSLKRQGEASSADTNLDTLLWIDDTVFFKIGFWRIAGSNNQNKCACIDEKGHNILY